MKSFFNAGRDTFPAEKLPVSSKQHFFDATRELRLNVFYELGDLFTAHGFSFSEFPKKVLSRFVNEAKHRAITLFTPVLCVMTLSAALLMTV
jgi:hypothetical protein